MKTNLSIVMLSILITACASQTRQAKVGSKTSSALVKADEVIGDELPEWTDKSGITDGRLYVVGYSEMSADKSPHYIKKAALMDGEVRLLSDAPSDFRVLTQNALKGAGVESSEFFQIQTKIQEVFAAEGIRDHESTCRKIARYGETQVRVVRGCWYRVSADVYKLKKAYMYTLAQKYGQEKSKKFDKLMDQEITKLEKR